MTDSRKMETGVLVALVIGIGVAALGLTLFGAELGSRLTYKWGTLIGSLALTILFILRRDDVIAMLIILVHLYVDWYLGIYVVGLTMTLALLIALFLARSPRYPWVEPRGMWLWGLFLLLTILPAAQGFTNLYDGTLYYPNDILGAFLIFWVGTLITRDSTSLRRLFMLLAFFGTLIAVHTIVQEVTGKFLFETPSATAVLASVSDYQLFGSGVNRVGSFFVDPNWDGTFLVVMLSLALGLFVDSTSLWGKLFHLTEIALILPALLFTFSIGSAIGAAAAVVAFIIFAGQMRYRFLLPAIVVLGAVIVMIAFPKEISVFLQHSSDPSEIELRKGAWTTAIRVIEAYPLTGVGMGFQTYVLKAEPFRVPEQFIPLVHPHDSYLELAAMAGLPVLFVFLALLLFALWLTLRNWMAADIRTRSLLGAGMAATVGLCANSVSINGWTLPPLAALGWLILGACSSSLLRKSLKHKEVRDNGVKEL